MMKRSLIILVAAFAAAQVQAGNLTQREINLIESEFGITLSSNQISELSAVVYPTNSVSWRIDAYNRIDSNRKADLDIQVVDQNGDPVEGAQVSVKLKSNDFKFGGTFSAKDFDDANGNLNMSTNTYRDRLLSMFNAVGLNNGFKPRLTSIHSHLPGVMSWAATNNLPVRGHLLIWPGTGDVDAMDAPGAVSGVDYGKHLSQGWTSAYANGNVLGAVEAYKVSARTQADKDAIETEVDDEILNWVSQWDVYEWDVINETLGNRLLMDIMGYDQMAEWFHIAESNKVSPDTKLLINDYQIITAMSEERTPGWYTNPEGDGRSDRYMTNINQIISDGGQIDRIGFQSRVKQERRDPELIYDRLEEWGNTYGLEMVGTEFEVVDSGSTNEWKWYIYTDEERAQITEEMMTQYFSHPLVTGFFGWDAISDDIASLIDYSGNPTLHGLVWYYLHRIRFATDAELATGMGGETGLRAFKGEYDVEVSYNGVDYASSMVLTNDESIVLQLGSSIADPSVDAAVVDAWHYDGLADGAGLGSASSTGIVGGVTFPNYGLGSIQNESIRWQSDGATDSMYRERDLSSYDGATNGVFELSADFLDADFSSSAALSNGLGRVQLAFRDTSDTDVGFRLVFTANGGSNALFRLEAADAIDNNHNLGSFQGTTLGHLSVRAVFDLYNRGLDDSFKVFYRHEGGAEVEAHSGRLPADFDLDKLRYVVQTYNGGANWATGDRISVDNLVVRKFGDAPTPEFLVDPISTSAATQDVAYAGETILGTATNVLSYAKVSGPAWLTIAADGTLSGTPTGADVGQNSWIVQASNGVESDTAVLKINVTGTGPGGPGSDISVVDTQTTSFSSGSGNVTGTVSTVVSAQPGDVIVVTAATNKRGEPGTSPIDLVQVGGTGVTGPQSLETNDLDTYPTSWAWYMTVTAPGTFTYELRSVNITALTAVYIVRAGSGTVELAGSATWDDTDNNSNPASHALNYTFSSSLPAGVLIESASARLDGLTAPGEYTADRTAGAVGTGYKRSLHSFDAVWGPSWSSVYDVTDGTQNTSGAIGLIFSEITASAGNNPPVFSADPVVEVGAVQDSSYLGSTLADHASDSDLDVLTYGLISGPAWLSVATNGALSGTPDFADVGVNSWKVSVTDGIATNVANLEIEVFSAAPPVASPDRDRLFPTNNYNVLFIAIDDMRPLINAYGEDEPLLPITPQMDRLAESGVMFANAHCQQAVCNASRASLLTGLRPDTTMCWNLSTHFRTTLPDIITLPQHFGANGYRAHGIGKIYHGISDANQDGPLSWNEGWANPSTGNTWYEDGKWQAEDAGSNKVSATDSGEFDFRADIGGSIPVTDASYNDGNATEMGVAKIAEYAAGYQTNGTPFFLGVGFQKPHMPFNAPKTYWDLYNPAQIDLTGYTGIRNMPVGSNKFTAPYGGEPSAFDDITGTSDNGMPDATEARHLIHGYMACVSFIDAQVGKLLDALEDPDGDPQTDDSIADSTIIVLWGDHGFHLGDHNGFWAKHSNYEISTRVPLIVRVPGMETLGAAGTRSVGLVELVDIYPTLVDLCSLPAPAQPAGQHLEGTTFLPLLEDPAQPWKQAVFTQFQRNINSNTPGDSPVANSGAGMGYSVRTERYRYTEWWVTSGGDFDKHIIAPGITEPGFVELYDYVSDPGETTNLAYNVSYSSLTNELSSLLNDPDSAHMGDGWTEAEADAPSEYPVDYAVWQTNYLAPGRVISELDANQDPDGDGIVNRLEYKFGTHPFEADVWPVEAGMDLGGLYITYPDVESRADILLEATATTNLVVTPWSGDDVSMSNEGQQGNAVIKTGTIPTTKPTQFLRLEATEL